MTTLTFEVSASEAGQRVDKVLVLHAPALGRRGAAELCEAGQVRVNGRTVAKAFALSKGQVVEAQLVDAPAVVPEPTAPLDVRFENAHVVIVCKPAGQPTAPLAPGEPGTLAGALLGRYPETRDIGYREREPGVIHRLDTYTSGLVIAARHATAFRELVAALRAGQIEKRYLAIVRDDPQLSTGRIDLPLAHEGRGSPKVIVQPTPAARGQASTRYRTLRRKSGLALLEVNVEHAFRHQVRAHLAAIGHPIAGDRLYGGPEMPELGPRHALHACWVAWSGTARLPGFSVEDGLPPDLERLFA